MDDICELGKSQFDVLVGSVRNETFQDASRLKFKPSKCKLIVMNPVEDIIDDIGGALLEIVLNHEYVKMKFPDLVTNRKVVDNHENYLNMKFQPKILTRSR